MRCKNCHYSLANLTENRCPECGNAFDPNDPSTFIAPVKTWKRHSNHIALALPMAALLVWLGLFCQDYFYGSQGGMFDNVRFKLLGAALETVLQWPLVMTVTFIVYLLLVGISALRRPRSSR